MLTFLGVPFSNGRILMMMAILHGPRRRDDLASLTFAMQPVFHSVVAIADSMDALWLVSYRLSIPPETHAEAHSQASYVVPPANGYVQTFALCQYSLNIRGTLE